MRAFPLAALFVSLLATVACDAEYIDDPRIIVTQTSSDASRLHAQLCQSHARVLFLAEDSVIRWRAMKNDVIPVEGTQRVSGYLASQAVTHMQSLQMRLDFDVASVESSDPLRDTRVMNYVLGLSEKLPMYFILEQSTDEGAPFPAGDEELVGSLAGTLTMTHKQSAVTLEGTLQKTPDGYALSNSTSPWTVNLVSQLQLGAEVERLMSLVEDVTLDENITITFDLALKDDCP